MPSITAGSRHSRTHSFHAFQAPSQPLHALPAHVAGRRFDIALAPCGPHCLARFPESVSGVRAPSGLDPRLARRPRHGADFRSGTMDATPAGRGVGLFPRPTVPGAIRLGAALAGLAHPGRPFPRSPLYRHRPPWSGPRRRLRRRHRRRLGGVPLFHGPRSAQPTPEASLPALACHGKGVGNHPQRTGPLPPARPPERRRHPAPGLQRSTYRPAQPHSPHRGAGAVRGRLPVQP